MNLDVMKTFCDLVDTGSFSRAAETNYVSQSAVSQQLAKLERELGTQLINRGGGLVEPTEAGKAFYNGAHAILRQYEQMLGEIRSAADAIRGVLRVGTIYSLGFYMLEPYIRRFLREHPEVKLHVEYSRWNRIYSSVVSGELDMGVVAYPQRHRSIEVIPLAKEELVLVCPPNHKLTNKGHIEPRDLEGEKFIAFDENVPTRRFIDRMLKNEKISIDIVMKFDNVELLKRAVEIGAGISILPLENVEREACHGDLAYVRFSKPDKWVRSLGILRRRGKAPTPAEKAFLAMLHSRLKSASQPTKTS